MHPQLELFCSPPQPKPKCRKSGPPCRPLVIAYGMGVDSTAVLIGLHHRGIVPDLITFADVGGEKPGTYAFLSVINEWLASVGFPQVTVVRYQVKNFKNWPPYHTLEENCLTNGTLPSLAFGFGSCSQKWKAAPQEKFLRRWGPALEAWAQEKRVCKAIGYDCSPRDRQRRTYADKATAGNEKYEYWYPLHDWGWTREECIAAIESEDLPVPPKSACFFCPATKPQELQELSEDLLKRIVIMEARAKPRLEKVEGLWRKATKKRPGTMTEYICSAGLLAVREINRLKREVPKELINRNAAHAAGLKVETWPEFFARVLRVKKKSPSAASKKSAA